MDFKVKPRAPATVSADDDSTLATKGYVDSQSGGNVSIPNLNAYAKKHEVVSLLNGYQKYVCNPDDWAVHTELDLTAIGMGVLPVSMLVASMGFDEPIDKIITYEGDDDYVIIPDTINKENAMITFTDLNTSMTRLLTFQQTGNLIEYSAPMGIGGEFPETTNARLADFALRYIDNESLDLRYLDTRRVLDFSFWFGDNTSLHIDISTWDVSSGTDFGGMFNNSAVTELDLSTWDVSSGTNFGYMFDNSAVTELDLSAWDVSNGEHFNYMFSSSAVTELDLSSWVLPGSAIKVHMLNTASLRNLYCKDETEADKLTTGTDIRTGVKVWVGKRGAPGTYLYKTT